MPKALFIIDQFASGGAPRAVAKLIRALVGHDIDITLVVLSDRHALELPGSVDVHRLPFSPRNRLEKLRRYALHARQLDHLLASLGTGFDLVVANLHHAHQVVRRSRTLRDSWLCIRSDPQQELLGGKKRGWQRWLKSRKVRWLYDDQCILALSATTLDSLNAIGVRPRETAIIPNVLEIDSIRQRMHQAEVPERDYLLYVGRLAMRQKRLDRLLRAYQQSGVAQRLVIIGDGDRQAVVDEIQALGLGDRVELLGALDNPYPHMHHARAVLLASDYEGLPNVLLESLACGTPVVSTDCPSGPRDILRGEQARFLVPLDDIAAFASAIRGVVAQPPNIDEHLIARYAPGDIAGCYHHLIAPHSTDPTRHPTDDAAGDRA